MPKITLDKAIELNHESEKSLRSHKFIDHANAVLLANQSLLRILVARSKGILLTPNKLPGEK